jgi:hypothetical protein
LAGSHLAGSHLAGSHLAGSHLAGSQQQASNVAGSQFVASNMTGYNLAASQQAVSNLSPNQQRTAFTQFINYKKPWGMYAARSYNSNILPDLTNNGRNAICTGVTLNNISGYGANVIIPYIYGSQTSTVNWPDGSIPTNFTVCSITRYTDGNNHMILKGGSGTWIHGHWGGAKGLAHYQVSMGGGDRTASTLTNWVVVCGKNNGTKPKNILVDNNPVGSTDGGTGGQIRMIINTIGQHSEKSDWAFSHLFIWDQNLTDDEMLFVSRVLKQYLVDGIQII